MSIAPQLAALTPQVTASSASPILLYLGGALVSVGLSWLLVHLLRGSLSDMLEELWASRARARYWAAVACILILLLGAFFGTGTDAYGDGGRLSLERGFFAVAGQLRWTLLGLFLATGAVSLSAMIFMVGADRSQRREESRVVRAMSNAPAGPGSSNG